MLELEALLTQLLPEAGVRGAPFNLNEIAGVLNEAYGSCSYHSVRRAWLALLESEHSNLLVRPLEGNGREFEFSADAARRIARRAVNGELPEKYRQTVPKRNQPKPRPILQNSLTAPKKRTLKTKNQQSATKVQPKRK